MTWEDERVQLAAQLRDAEMKLRAVLASPNIWHRVRQASLRALEQVEAARDQLDRQDHPL